MDQPPIDETALRELMVESQDTHSDVMRHSSEMLRDFVDTSRDLAGTEGDDLADQRAGHRGLALAGAAVAGVAGIGLLASSPAYASSTDIMILQTAASIENLAVATYAKALTLPFIGGSGANPVVKAFVTTTKQQHYQHGLAFNAAVVSLGGKKQTAPDPVYLRYVESKVPGLTGPLPVVQLAITLEDIAAQTYTKNVSEVSSSHLKELLGSVAPIEAQHRAILLAVQALLAGNLAADITLPPPAAKLPAAAGSVGFPTAFYPTASAAPASQGAVA